MLKKLPSDKINVPKNALFFFRKLKLITVLLLIRNTYTQHMVHLCKTVCGNFQFRFRLVFIKHFIFVQ